MDWPTVITAVTSSAGVSAAGAHWLARTLIQHRLTHALEERRAQLTRELDIQKALAAQDLERLKDSLQLEQSKAKSAMDAEIRKQVEIQLGEVSVQRQYEYEARRRLYLSIGPLRFQLLVACRDLVGRVQAIGASEKYAFQLDGYYARSTIYRLLKPIALASLIEEQMALNDFSVDQEAIDFLRFRRSVTRIYSGDELVANHPRANWAAQVEHLFADSLSSVVQSLVERSDEKQARPLRFDEFNQKIETHGWSIFSPIDQLFDQFEVVYKPILWLRLVAYAQVCNALVTRHGVSLGFRDESFDAGELLLRSQDLFIQTQLDELLQKIKKFETLPL